MSRKVAVVGAGINGISSAIALQEAFPSIHVTIIAEKFSPHLTSDVAAGFWEPHLVATDDENKMREILNTSFNYIASLVPIPNSGAMWQSGVEVSKEKYEERPMWADIVRGFRELTNAEAESYGKEYKSGWFFTTLGLEPTTYIRYATDLFLSRGGCIQQRKVESLDGLTNEYSLVVNCSGLGAISLVGDTQMKPIRGQVIRVKAPKVKHFFLDSTWYCLLNGETMILGGSHDENEWDTTPNPQTAQMILEETAKRVPELKGATIISHHVGLRPVRSSLRLEKEVAKNGKGLIIHNYGHGGSGITIFWGCALNVVDLATSHLSSSHL